MTLLASNPPYRPIVRVAGGTIEHREPAALSSAAWIVRFEGETLATGTASVVTNTGPDYVVYTATIPALTVQPGYELVLAPGAADERVRLFDVARQDYGPLLTEADLLAERPDAGLSLDQSAGYESGLDAADIIWTLSGRARAMLDDMVRDRLLQIQGPDTNQARVVDDRGRGEVYLRGWMVADMDRLRRVERYLLVYEHFVAKMTGTAEEDEAGNLAQTYLGRAKAALASVGRIRIDIDQDGKPDETVEVSRSFRLRRVQG